MGIGAEIDRGLVCEQAARNMKADGEAALEVARTQQEADKAMAEIKQASHNIKAALAFRPQPEPIPEPINKDAVYFEVQPPPIVSCTYLPNNKPSKISYSRTLACNAQHHQVWIL